MLWLEHSCKAGFALTAEMIAEVKRGPFLPPTILLMFAFAPSVVMKAPKGTLVGCFCKVFLTAIVFSFLGGEPCRPIVFLIKSCP